jgi:hypothetical protein
MREIHIAIFLNFLFCAGTVTPHHVGLIMQMNMTQIWVRCSLYMAGNVLNNLLIKHSKFGCFSANIMRVQFWGGMGGPCSLNGVEY